jgi:hypothetical protein
VDHWGSSWNVFVFGQHVIRKIAAVSRMDTSVPQKFRIGVEFLADLEDVLDFGRLRLRVFGNLSGHDLKLAAFAA